MTMKVGVVIVCAGQGKRFGSRNKSVALLAGKPLLYHSVKAFCSIGAIKQIIVVVQQRHQGVAYRYIPTHLCKRHNICFTEGGRERIDSVRHGLRLLDEQVDYVLIHDGARPLVSAEVIKRILAALRTEKAVICGLAARDTLKKLAPRDYVAKTLERNGVVTIQTPQGFRKDIVLAAYKKCRRRSALDDSQLVEALGVNVKVVAGDVRNIKITYPGDLELAKKLLG